MGGMGMNEEGMFQQMKEKRGHWRYAPPLSLPFECFMSWK
jgi:hypothetical protein